MTATSISTEPRRGIEKELERGVDPPRAAPDADDQKHRDQAAFEEQIEQDQIQRDEDADHQRFEHEEGDHEFLDALLDRGPAGQDAERHQERGQNDERQRDSVDAQMVADGAAEPGEVFLELKAGFRAVELGPGVEREAECHRGGEERDAARERVAGLAFACHQECHQDAEQRKERDRRQQIGRHGAPPAMNQVARSATPISIAKA
jgi:hypothetical protein